MTTPPAIQCHLYPNRISELSAIASLIHKLINTDTQPCDICVIAPKHKLLEELVPFLLHYDIPIYYQKRSNVLDSQIIKIVITIARFVVLYSKDVQTATSLIPEILAHPSFEIDTIDIWKLAIQAKNSQENWIEVIIESDNDKLKSILIWLVELSQKQHLYQGEMILDCIIGTNNQLYIDQENYSEIEQESQDNTGIDLQSNFKSPIKNYFFGTDNTIEDYTPKYLRFLTDLRVLYQTIRSQNTNQSAPSLSQILELIEFYTSNKQSIINNNPLNRSDRAVNLMSVHKVKGLEYKYVFVINFSQDSWLGNKRGAKLSLPKYLNLGAESEDRDDHLRLIYVAMTRARDHLIVSCYSESENGKATVPMDLPLPWEQIKTSQTDSINQLEILGSNEQHFMINTDLQDLLSPLVENYKLSVTHYNTFTDLENGGALAFIERHLLSFPQAKSIPAMYGTAIHEALSVYHSNFLKTGGYADLDTLMRWFIKSWQKQHPPENIYQDYIDNQARPNLDNFISTKGNYLNEYMETEKDFTHENVSIGQAKIKGKIDRLERDLINKLVTVVDYKTGNALVSLDKGTAEQKIKAQKMKNQLMFYKLLVQNSRTYHGYKVNTGVLEFVQAKPDQMVLSWQIDPDELKEFEIRVQQVYNKIINLDFTDDL
jgi:DNA helicase II / ATP-dependent DNA helicase PcrA